MPRKRKGDIVSTLNVYDVEGKIVETHPLEPAQKLLEDFRSLPVALQEFVCTQLLNDPTTFAGTVLQDVVQLLNSASEREKKTAEWGMKQKLAILKFGRPKKNAERDAEIMRLHDGGKTGGQIAKAISSKWKVKSATVRRVISRELGNRNKSSSAEVSALAQK